MTQATEFSVQDKYNIDISTPLLLLKVGEYFLCENVNIFICIANNNCEKLVVGKFGFVELTHKLR